ncbi:class I SAM-dependent methyltransferase [Streptomyces aureus]|uniref:class I SAM-dependent methyltransferase n=1 Tax=Streptomyces aureus TaxID=193461 RepID=UPI00055CEBAF|nr:class I SAM-dependent methyltransferase [Streptomyces aureus]
MFTPQGPSLRELAVQALSSIERGYDLLAPKFDHTPFRTPDVILDAVGDALAPMGPFAAGLDLCCGTGAGMEVLREVCRESVTGVDISAGMLAVGRSRLGGGDRAPSAAGGGRSRDSRPGAEESPSPKGASRAPTVAFVRADARALPFGPAFDLVVSFGAFGHFLRRELPGLFSGVHAVLRPGGSFAFPIMAPPRPGSPGYWALLGFDTVMRLRNAVRRPTFVMYYRTFRLADVERELARAGFRTELHPLTSLGCRRDGSPRARMVVATRAGTDSVTWPPEG